MSAKGVGSETEKIELEQIFLVNSTIDIFFEIKKV